MKKQNIIIVLIFLCLLTLAVGYVIFRTDTDVNTKTAKAKNLDVVFTSIGDITEVDCNDSSAYISFDRKTVTIDVPNLLNKGAYVLVPVTIKNVGTLPARLQSINQFGSGNDLSISVTYHGIGITDVILNPGDEKSFYVKVMWKRDLIVVENNYNFMIRFNYIQA